MRSDRLHYQPDNLFLLLFCRDPGLAVTFLPAIITDKSMVSALDHLLKVMSRKARSELPAFHYFGSVQDPVLRSVEFVAYAASRTMPFSSSP